SDPRPQVPERDGLPAALRVRREGSNERRQRLRSRAYDGGRPPVGAADGGRRDVRAPALLHASRPPGQSRGRSIQGPPRRRPERRSDLALAPPRRGDLLIQSTPGGMWEARCPWSSLSEPSVVWSRAG